jgi:prepilin-type N-terminal cleavage/methylation domain-containing protein
VNSFTTGFTIVELVAVIALIGVLMALSLDRLADTGLFDERVVEDRILSLARGTQQLSFAQANVQLKLSLSGSTVVVSSLVGGVTDRTMSFSSSEVAITAGSVGLGTDCGAISSPVVLTFTSGGEIEAGDSDGFPICLNDQSSLCISPTGFAHSGSCL